MSGDAKRPLALGFEPEIIVVPVATLMPVKTLRPTVKISHKYLQIAQSVREIGLVEPPVVARDPAAPGR